MGQVCRHCSRLNPDDAVFCYFDGKPIATDRRGHALDAGSQRFPSPLTLPSGEKCHSFNELATYCWQNWEQTLEAVQLGTLERFLGSIGRVDLAMAVRQAAESPDRQRGLDELLGKLPSKVLAPAKLSVDREEIKLGTLRLGEDRIVQIRLRNEGMRLLFGAIRCENCVWLTIGEGAGVASKMLAFTDDLIVKLQVHGHRLRAGSKPQVARVEIDSNGGTLAVAVQVEVPARPFPAGALAGAITPRQVAEKAKASPRAAAALFEKGMIARWYRANGWDYPVKIPAASGIASIQQFFEALGLTAPPQVTIQPTSLKFKARAGSRLHQSLEVSTQEKRPVWAYAICDQPWLKVTKVADGKSAVLRVDVPSVPDQPGTILRGQVTILSNGRRRFVVPVIIGVVPRLEQKIAPPVDVAPVEPLLEVLPVEPVAEVLPVEPVEEVEEVVEVVEEQEPLKAADEAAADVVVVEEESPAEVDVDVAERPAAAQSGNPFAFDDGSFSRKKRRRKTSLFAKLFPWMKKR